MKKDKQKQKAIMQIKLLIKTYGNITLKDLINKIEKEEVK